MALVAYTDSEDDDNDISMDKGNQPKLIIKKTKRSFESYTNTEPHSILIDHSNKTNDVNQQKLPKPMPIKKRRKLKVSAPKINPFSLNNNYNDSHYKQSQTQNTNPSFGNLNDDNNYHAVPPPTSFINDSNKQQRNKPFIFTVNNTSSGQPISFKKNNNNYRRDKTHKNSLKFAPRQIRNKKANINTEDYETYYSAQSFKQIATNNGNQSDLNNNSNNQ